MYIMQKMLEKLVVLEIAGIGKVRSADNDIFESFEMNEVKEDNYFQHTCIV